MLSPSDFAGQFARTAELFRDPSAKDAQKAEFRVLMHALAEGAVTLRVERARLVVNGTPLDGPLYDGLAQRLELHGVSEIALAADAPPAEVFNLLRAIADQPGVEDVGARLRHSGATRVSVEIASLFAEEPPPALPDMPALERSGETPAIVTGLDIGAGLAGNGPVAPGAANLEPLTVEHAPPPPPPPPASMAPPPPPRPPSLPPPVPATDLVPFTAVAPGAPASPTPRRGASPADDGLRQLEKNPTGPAVGDILAILGGFIDQEVKQGKFEHALKLVAGIVRCEERLPESGPRRQYAIALKRIYTKPLLDALVQLMKLPAHEEDAALALRRAGADGVEVLLDMLVSSPTVAERRGVFNALAGMKEGGEQLIHMLDHPQWYVVRNIAELVGEMGLESAVPALARQLGHDDERVRKAVALALAKIATRSAAEPLRRALRDASPAVRLQAAIGVGGRKANALAMPLVVALDEEKDPEVTRELILALGRIGSPDAVQALIKLAQPSGKILGRKPTAVRVAAVEALRLAGGAAATGTLQGLAEDSDRQVRAAAQAAAAELVKR